MEAVGRSNPTVPTPPTPTAGAAPPPVALHPGDLQSWYRSVLQMVELLNEMQPPPPSPDVTAHPQFGNLSAGAQTRMRELARTPGRAEMLEQMVGSADFRALSPELQALTLDRFGAHTDEAARASITRLATSPGFRRLPAARQERLMRYIGGSNDVVSPSGRRALDSMMASAGYRNATPEAQAKWLTSFLRDQPGAAWLRDRRGETPRDEPTRPMVDRGVVANHPFASGRAQARRYDVTFGDQTISIYAPVRVTETIDGRPAQQHTPEQIVQALGALPPEIRARIRQVDLAPGRNPDDAHWATAYERDRRSPGETGTATTFSDWAARYRYERRGRPTGEFRSYATAGEAGVVTFYPSRDASGQATLDNTLVHEAGHILTGQLWGEGGQNTSTRISAAWRAWRDAIAADGVRPSSYAQNSPTEDFSEALSLYFVVRGTPAEAEMRALMPERFAILDRYLRSWRR